MKTSGGDRVRVWPGDVSTSSHEPLFVLRSKSPWFSASTIETNAYDQMSEMQVKLVYREGEHVLYLGDPSEHGAIPVAYISHQVDENYWGVRKHKFAAEIAAGMDVAFVAALMVLVHDSKLRLDAMARSR